MYQEELHSGEMTRKEVFEANVQWIQDMAGEVASIHFPEHEEEG